MRWCLFGEVVERAKAVSGQAVSGGKRPIVGSPPQKFLMNADCLANDKKQQITEKLDSFQSSDINDNLLLTVLKTQQLVKEIYEDVSQD